MSEFKTFVGKIESHGKDKHASCARICEDVCCKSFKEARAKALALYREKRPTEQDLLAFVLCADPALFIGSGIRPGNVRNFGNGYCVDVTPSMPLPDAPRA